MRNLPDTTFSLAGPITTTAKATGTCTGTVSQGAVTVNVTGVSITSRSVLPGGGPATCRRLVDQGMGPENTATFTSTFKWRAANGKIADSSATATVEAFDDGTVAGLTLASVSSGGSLAGASAVITAYMSVETIIKLQSEDVNSYFPVPFSPCQAGLRIKNAGMATESVKFVKPKGFKQFDILGTSALTVTKGA